MRDFKAVLITTILLTFMTFCNCAEADSTKTSNSSFFESYRSRNINLYVTYASNFYGGEGDIELGEVNTERIKFERLAIRVVGPKGLAFEINIFNQKVYTFEEDQGSYYGRQHEGISFLAGGDWDILPFIEDVDFRLSVLLGGCKSYAETPSGYNYHGSDIFTKLAGKVGVMISYKYAAVFWEAGFLTFGSKSIGYNILGLGVHL